MTTDTDKIAEALPAMPPVDAMCHIGICSQDKCVNCQRIKAAWDELDRLRAERSKA